jgi:putative membrane protein
VAVQFPYCGFAPLPGALLGRFNLDPVLIAALIFLCTWQLWAGRHCAIDRRARQIVALTGWLIAASAFLSPLCALSVALFSARVAQHMILLFVAAPLIATAWAGTQPAKHPQTLWVAAAVFFLALWYWHMPIPYEETFRSVAAYWAMHVSLFGSGIWLWREFLQHAPERIGPVLVASMLTFLQMGLLGAVLTLAGRPLFQWHALTTQAWGLSPLQDQQLGGALMWVPGIALFLWSALRSLGRLWGSLERAHPA